MLLVPDIILYYLDKTNVIFNPFVILLLIVMCFTLSFAGIFIKLFSLLYLFLTQIISVNYVISTGKQIESTQILYALKNIEEVFNNFNQTWWTILVILLPFVFLFIYTIMFRKQMMFSWLSVIFILSFAIILISYNGFKLRKTHSYSKPTKLVFYNNIKTFPYFITHIHEKKNKTPISFRKRNDISIIQNNKPNIIVLIIADNINANALSLFNDNFDFNTTPRLGRMIKRNKNNFFLSNGIATSFNTASSLSQMFHILYNGVSSNCIVKNQTQNILQMAKNNGYTTHWIGYDKLSLLEQIGVKADDIKNQSHITHFNQFVEKQDDYLIDLFRELEVQDGKHLIVIHLKTAVKDEKDGDYITNYKHHGEVFAEIKNEKTGIQSVKDTYRNSIIYLDYLVESFLEIAMRKNVDYLFFTSSTGFDFDKLEDNQTIESLNIPLIVYTNDKNNGNVNKYFAGLKRISNYNISKYIASLIGYDIKNYYEEPDNYYITNDVFDENDRHILVNIDAKGNAKQVLEETMNDYYKRNEDKYKKYALKGKEKANNKPLENNKTELKENTNNNTIASNNNKEVNKRSNKNDVLVEKKEKNIKQKEKK